MLAYHLKSDRPAKPIEHPLGEKSAICELGGSASDCAPLLDDIPAGSAIRVRWLLEFHATMSYHRGHSRSERIRAVVGWESNVALKRNDSLPLTMQLLAEGTVFRGTAGTPTASNCFTAIASLADGSLLTSWRAGSRKDSADGQVLLSRSTDGGRNWSPPEPFCAGPWVRQPVEVRYAPITVLGDGRLLAVVLCVDRSNPALPFFHPVTEGLLPTSTWLCESRDGGRSWTDFRIVETSPESGPLAITGPVLVLDDGRLACQVEVNKSYDDAGPWRHAARWKISRDGGYHWLEQVDVAHDPTGRVFYWDARYNVGDGGHVVAAFWAYDRKQQRDLNIHFSDTRDGGRTWCPPRDCGLVGQVCQPVLVGGDRLLLVYVDRFGTRAIRAALSHDLGRSFVEDMPIYRHPAAEQEQGSGATSANYLQDMELWTFGRTDAFRAPDETVWVVYYAGNAVATDVRWARLEV